ncbi:MAG: peptidoglycan binding domain-containing protein [Blautia sp.]|nr:peptidoglycan binding domain-containing protein [Blautia sp.]
MSKDEKRTQRGPGGFEDKIDAAMADLEVDLDDEFHGADFFDEEDTQSSEDGDFDSWDDTDEADDQEDSAEEDYEEEYPEEEEYDSEYSDEFEEESEEFDDEEDSEDDVSEDEESEEGYDYEDQPDEEDDSYDDESDVPQERELQVEEFSTRSGRKRSRREKKESTQKQSARPASRSARPTKIAYVPISEEELDEKIVPIQKKKHKGLKVTGIIAAILAVTVGCAYGAVTYYYADRFFEGTYINGIDCSNKTAYEVEQAIASTVEAYSIEVTSRNQDPQTISGSQIGYQYMSDGEVLNLLKQQKPYEWVRGFMETRSYNTQENVTFDKTLLQNEVKALNCAQPENQVEPENAYVAMNGDEFTIVPETEGSKLKVKEAYKALDAAISGSQTSIDLGSTPDVYAVAAVTSEDSTLQATRDAYNNYTKASITYTFGDQTVTLDGSTLKNWLQFDEKGQLVQDDASFTQHVKDFVAQLASEHNTVGTTRSFNTTSGRTVSVYGSAYGWKIDQDAEAAQLTEEIRTGTQTTREPVYSMRANAYGYNDIGSTYIEVDLSSQHMYYYQGGSIIFDSDIVSGDIRYDDRATPPGIFTLYYKKSPDVLRGAKKPDGTYEYETSVTYWMPFNGGIGFHDATWQAYFGGDRYTYAGSHGCINMPLDAAATLYSIIDTNVPIVCFY